MEQSQEYEQVGSSNDDEWEYEYSTSETETHYAIIDLGPNAVFRSNRFSQRAAAREQEGTPASEGPPTPTLVNEGEPSASPAPSQQQPERNNGSSAIQLLDLNTRQPLLSHESHLYTLRWADSISSTMVFAPTHPNPTLLTTSAPRLIATPTNMVPKPMDRIRRAEQLQPSNASSSTSPASNSADPMVTDNIGPPLPPSVDQDLRIPLGPNVSVARRKQADFLEQLMMLKRQKGETDEVTVYAKKYNRKPGTARRQRRSSTTMTTATTPEGDRQTPLNTPQQTFTPMTGISPAQQTTDTNIDPLLVQRNNTSMAWPGVSPQTTSPATTQIASIESIPPPPPPQFALSNQRASKNGRARGRGPTRRGRQGRPAGSRLGRADRPADVSGLWGGEDESQGQERGQGQGMGQVQMTDVDRNREGEAGEEEVSG